VPDPRLRFATLEDVPAIQELMRDSVRAIFPRFYDARQTTSGIEHIALLDLALVEDGTYYVHEDGGEIVACGGWSRRAKLHAGAETAEDDGRLLDPATEAARVRAMFVRADHTRKGLGRAIIDACEDAAGAEGFTTLALMATLPGERLYRACGFREVERTTLALPDGVDVACVTMERSID
jgi:GNAT superfamily N-acetyltransferase